MVPFNSNRCMRLIGDLLIENKKSLLLFWVLPIVGLVTFIVLMDVSLGDYRREVNYWSDIDVDRMWSTNMFFMAFIFVLMCCIVASRGLSNTSNKQLAVSTLMLPVSEKERYIARYVIYVPVYTLALFGGMFLVECLRFSILKIIYPHSPFLHFLGLSFFTPDIFPWIDFALFFIGVQSFFFLSGAVWPRLGMVYAVVYFVAFNVLNGILASVILTNCNYDYLPFRHDFEWSQREENIFSLVLSLTFCVVSCGINYVLAYFRCKEREIINRW